jgi:NodT family efflux transporter outer membrane factor (OMF) lipoprotein
VTKVPIVEQPTLPASFAAAAAVGNAGRVDSQWYGAFNSDELTALIRLAGTDNLDIAAANARLRQAAARIRVVSAQRAPQVNVGASAVTNTGRAGADSLTETNWAGLFSLSNEFDFWGRAAVAIRSAKAQAAAAAAQRDALALTTQAAVASSYFQLLSLRERMSLASQNLDASREVLAVIEARFNAGAASAVDLAIQRAAVANAQLTTPELQLQELAVQGSLALLVGRDPEGFALRGNTLNDIAAPTIAAGLPSELLTRRPDVVAAEAILAAANADVAVARAALMPSFTLTGAGGIQNPAVQAAVSTLERTGLSLNLGASLIHNIFDGGGRRANIEVATARAEELLHAYRSTLRSALLEVENALGSATLLAQQEGIHAESATQSERALEGARLRYAAGSGDYLTMLEAQRSLYAVRDAEAQYRLGRIQNRVALYKALGGGWQVSAETTP